MKNFLLLTIAAFFFASCNNNANTKKTFCDTTCAGDSIVFTGDQPKFRQSLIITMNNCKPDTVIRTYEGLGKELKTSFSEYAPQDVRINKSAMNVVFQDTVSAWLSFNDCITGRGYLIEFPYTIGKSSLHTSAALNAFDKKFSIDPDLRAYTDRGNIFVVNVTNGQQAQMTFKENYEGMDFNDIHKTIDSINITKKRIYVKLLKNGTEIPIEKNISL